MRKTFTKIFAASIICGMLSVGAMAGDISSGFAGDISSGTGKCGDISCGKTISTKDTIITQVILSLTGILLGD